MSMLEILQKFLYSHNILDEVTGMISLESLLWSTLIVFVSVYIHKILFSPIDRVKEWDEIGFESYKKRKTSKLKNYFRLNEVLKMKKFGTLPPWLPNGWFAIAESRDIKKLQVKSIQALNETFAVFRDANGVVRVVDAICPHLGANMGEGGTVKGSCIECPFHGWTFDAIDGHCTNIPYSNKIPEYAKVKSWECLERNGSIFVWYHAEKSEPSWQIPEFENINNGKFIYRGRTEHHVAVHIQEIPENGADSAHLEYLHSPNIFKGGNLAVAYTPNTILDMFSHEWKANWSADDLSDTHIAKVFLSHDVKFLNKKLPFLGIKVEGEQIGPGFVALHFETSIGRAILVQTVTPLAPLKQRLIHRFYSASTFVAPLAKILILTEAWNVERDVMIWNSKTFLSKPVLVSEDKNITKFRRWFRQFYSENSPKITDFNQNSLDW